MSKITISEWYSRVNEAWGADPPLPNPEEAMVWARKLYRSQTSITAAAVKLTSGNRYTWGRWEGAVVTGSVRQLATAGALDAVPMVVPDPKVVKREAKRQKCLEAIRKWESKLRRAENALTKYRRQLRYCERSMPG
jgi:hypothetical protein